jgi:aldehyde dehydrogenase (NAD+)
VTVLSAPTELLPKPALLIGDRWLTSSTGGQFEHVYAANGEPTGYVPLAGAKEMDEAVSAARRALPAWRKMTGDKRRDLLLAYAALLETHRDRLSHLNVIDNATPLALAQYMPAKAIDLFRYNAGWADKIGGDVIPTWPAPAFDYTRQEPYGVVAIIIPWNGPISAIGMTAAPALAAGNCLVIKPPELAPYAALEMGRLFLEAGFPPGVVNVVPAGPAGGEALCRHPDVDKIHFTGSGFTARKILAAALDHLVPVGLELGGKSANIIFDDADVADAIPHTISAVANLSGQGCVLGTRALVHRAIYDEVIEGVVEAVGAMSIGDPMQLTTRIGPVVSADACARILGTIERARTEGHGRLVLGGDRLSGELADGYFVSPTIFADVDNASPLAQEEIFGPVLSIIGFDDDEEAIRLANATPYGLAAYVHTQNLRRAHTVAAELQAGNVAINGTFANPISAPFGGVKQSGYGRLGGIDGIREFSRPKNVWMAM